ncbi:MAG: anaerobic ribonucleoside-triphosphate reductase activating protein [Clostridium sp.]
MNYAQIRKFDVTNGPGVRTTLFVSGCTHNCDGCFNDVQQNFNYGTPFTKETEDEFIKYALNPQIVGVSILGGDPLDQTFDDTLLNLLRRLNKEVKKPIWLWSGYTYEEIIDDPKKIQLICEVNVLIDGEFKMKQRDLSLKYRGSANQRVIDIAKSINYKEIIEVAYN